MSDLVRKANDGVSRVTAHFIMYMTQSLCTGSIVKENDKVNTILTHIFGIK